ncbi:MAG: DUF2029 domain-containing protein [Saprospiraceae bacterium]|nr:DUF2029 domain-containing protein [Saprospiraceae bacterium]
MKKGNSHIYPYLAAVLWLLLGGYQLWKIRDVPVGDFANYYYASQALLAGEDQDAQLYEPYTFNLWVNERSPEALFVNYAPVPPVSVLAYLPFAQIADVYQAKLLFNGLGLVFFVLVFLWGVREQVKLRRDEVPKDALNSKNSETAVVQPELGLVLCSIPFVLWTPLFNNFYQGQSYLYIVSFLWLGYIFWQKNKVIQAALFWALPISLKIFPAILLLFILCKRQYQIFGWTLGFTFLFSVLPIGWLGQATVIEYFQDILPRLFAGEINDPYTILYQSARVFIDQLFILDGHLNPTPLMDSPGLAALIYLIFQWIVLGLLVHLAAKGSLPNIASFGAVLLAGLLLSGYGSNYSMLLLFFPSIGILVTNKFRINGLWMGALFLIFLAGNIPIYQLQESPFILQFPRLYVLLLLFLWIYWLEGPAFQPKIWIAIGGLLLLKWGFSGIPQNQLADYYLPDGQYPIIFDYEHHEDGLRLKHYRGQGPEEDIHATTDQVYVDSKLSIQHQQVFYDGQALTDSKGRKKKPMRLNTNEIIYLSDEGRGVGFYTLRKLKLP